MKKKIALFLTLILLFSAFCAITASAAAPGKTGTFFTGSDVKAVYCPKCGLFMGYATVTTQTTYQNGQVVSTTVSTIGPMTCQHCGYVVMDGSNVSLVEKPTIPGTKMG